MLSAWANEVSSAPLHGNSDKHLDRTEVNDLWLGKLDSSPTDLVRRMACAVSQISEWH
jgi:hypothetical protein